MLAAGVFSSMSNATACTRYTNCWRVPFASVRKKACEGVPSRGPQAMLYTATIINTLLLLPHVQVTQKQGMSDTTSGLKAVRCIDHIWWQFMREWPNGC